MALKSISQLPVFAKAHIFIKGVNFTQLKLGMSQLLYCASKQQVLSNIGGFSAEKWPTTVKTGWSNSKIF